MAADAGAGSRATIAEFPTTREAAVAYKAAVLSDKIVDLIDANPFGVKVDIKATLGSALDRIASAS